MSGPSILRAALPEPKRARKEAFFKFSSPPESLASRLQIAIAKAAIPLAEDAIPLLCGKLFEVSTFKL
ncbi:MAG: Uncharacterised protein [Flavobacteriaceae bacterium]|nr:MAG: Uncharacterised protein [Flavobacteriaceae bacterium]